MALHSFCGILTLQVGVAMIAVVFWTIATLTFVVNFFEFFGSTEFPVYALTISTFVVLLLFGGLIAFFSAYNESNALSMTGVALTALTTVVWVTISSLSFYNDQATLPFVCVHNRCPETFWLAPLQYRKSFKIKEIHENETFAYEEYTTSTTTKPEEPQNLTKEEIVIKTFKIPPMIDDQHVKVFRKSNLSAKTQTDESSYPELDDIAFYKEAKGSGDDVPTTAVTKSGYEFGIPLFGAVILFICNFFFFLFSILVLWSYGQELEWTNAYLQDIPEYTME